jgi:pantoate--beta-alanine ligase
MNIVGGIEGVRAAISRRRTPGDRLGFVPTMGALHEGHVTLFRTAREECDVVVASIFVNPRQFNDPRDLTSYPRRPAQDAAVTAAAGVDVLFMPRADEIYPDGRVTDLHVGGPALGFEGAHRPGHFDGVALVCLKLFNIVRPDVVYLGQKDAQQVEVIAAVISDFDLGIDVRVVPTVRDEDGLAMSSRNVRLSPDARHRALAIPRALRAAVGAHRDGQDPVAAARAALDGLETEYVDIARFRTGPTLVIAARAGGVRLIDNVPLDYPERAGLS